MIWELSEGTTVALGGTVTGTGPLADDLRQDVRWTLDGNPVPVTVLAPGQIDLDLGDPEIVDTWLSDMALRHDVTVVKAPTFKRTLAEQFPPSKPREGWIH